MGQCGTSSQLSLWLCWSKVTRTLISRLPVSHECKKIIHSQWNAPWRKKKLVIFRVKQLPWAFELPRDSQPWALTQHMAAVMGLLSVAWRLFVGTASWAWAAARWATREDAEVQVQGQGCISNDVWVGLCLHACSVLKRIMILWAVKFTFCTILDFLVITTITIVKKHMWDSEQPVLLHCPVCVLICSNSFHIFPEDYIRYFPSVMVLW